MRWILVAVDAACVKSVRRSLRGAVDNQEGEWLVKYPKKCPLSEQ